MKDLQRGMLLTFPLVTGVIVVSLLYSVMARQIGFSPWEAWAMCRIVCGGSAQFAVLRM
jgi:predicted branched-subunit amino acid permease